MLMIKRANMKMFALLLSVFFSNLFFQQFSFLTNPRLDTVTFIKQLYRYQTVGYLYELGLSIFVEVI